MTDSSAKRKMRWWVPVGLVLLIYGFVGFLFVTQDVSRHMAWVLLTVLALPLLALWYIWLTQLPWKRRLMLFGIWVLCVSGGGAALPLMTRWDGSLNGGAIPRLVWKWSSKLDARLDQLEGTGGEATLKTAEQDFPQFLGPNRNGILPGLNLEPDWLEHPPKELWRRKIGAGWSGFTVAEGRALTQEQRGKNELVSCYDLVTGEPLWVHENETRFEEAMGGDGPRANPTIHDGRVYALGATGILDCLELSSGDLVWTRNILAEHDAKNVMYGKACSPLIVGDLVIVTGGTSPGPTVLAYHREKGELAWSAGDDSASYASPIVTTLAGQEQIVSLNHNTVTGHEVATGEILWTWKWAAKMPKSALAQPVGENRLFVSASYGMGTALLEVSRKGEGFTVAKVWKNLQMKTKFSNVCLKDGYAYGLDEGRIACVEVATGKRQWRGAKYGYGQNLLAGDHLVIQSERGFVTLVEATPEKFREVARLEALRHKTWNTLALAGEYLLVRNDREAVCYRVKLK
ncbi:MAG: PQQ-binding-like beta-propeller repeat protein [Roseibacillus sp.]